MAIVKLLSLPRMNDGECKKYCSAETRTEHIMVNKDDSDTGMQSVLIETGLGVKETLGRFLSQAKEEEAVVEGAAGLLGNNKTFYNSKISKYIWSLYI